ncbi:DUF6326 family protein [Rhizosaccharibacter radicis]|uniref:DUF6326 family protein n=1 Tax=Rhizosaccharibacter radicis TaxID=2782605 RepID=A0ABT1W2D1_9PROT|nr:DUF6326 family protein [Acetobacteraceae bacterium KSS12]
MTAQPIMDRPPVRLTLAALWTSTMFCYVYGDYFGLYVPGTVSAMDRGLMRPLGHATPTLLVTVALMMAAPALMISLCLLLPRPGCRWANIGFGLFYTLIMAATLDGSPPFYLALALIEMGLTLSVALVAARWPKSGMP